MRTNLLHTIIELHEAAAAHSRHNPPLARLLTKAADQLDAIRREAMPEDEPVIILGYSEEVDKPHG